MHGLLGQKVPFIAALCGIPHKLISGEQPKDVWEWYDDLKNVDRFHTEMTAAKLYGSISVMIMKSLQEFESEKII